MKEKIFISLKTKYANLGLSDLVLNSVTAMLEGKITEESQIETEVSGVESLLKSFQSDVDKRVQDAVKKAKPEPATETKKEDKGESTPQPKEGADIAKIIADALKPLTDEIAAIKSGETTKTRKQQFDEILKEATDSQKTLLQKSFNKMAFDNDDDFSTYLTEAKTDLEALAQQDRERGLGVGGSPQGGGLSNKTATKEEVADIVKNLV